MADWLTDILHRFPLLSVQVVAYPPPLCTSRGKMFEKKPPPHITTIRVSISSTHALLAPQLRRHALHLCHHHYPRDHITAVYLPIHSVSLRSVTPASPVCASMKGVLSTRRLCTRFRELLCLEELPSYFCASIFSPAGRTPCLVSWRLSSWRGRLEVKIRPPCWQTGSRMIDSAR